MMNAPDDPLPDWLIEDDDVVFKAPEFDPFIANFEIHELSYSDLLSDGDIFGAELRELAKPTDGKWPAIIENQALFKNFDLTYSDHEIIISGGTSTIYDSSGKDTVVFSNGPHTEIHAQEKALDLFLDINEQALVHSENSDLNIYSFESSEGHTKITGTVKSLNISLFAESEISNQNVIFSDEKLLYEDSGQIIVDLKDVQLSVLDINLTFLNSNGVDSTDVKTVFLDGPERELVAEDLPSLEHLMFEEEMELNYAHSVEVQLFASTIRGNYQSPSADFELYSDAPNMAIQSMESQAMKAIEDLSTSQELLNQDTLFDDPLDILIFDL